jgi:hypothetical protein
MYVEGSIAKLNRVGDATTNLIDLKQPEQKELTKQGRVKLHALL